MSDGTASVSALGGTGVYSFVWSSGGILSTETGLASGNYTVTVEDENGCFVVETANISNSGAPTVNVTSSDVLCNGSSNGSIDLTVSGGTGAYSYAWDNGSLIEDLTNISAGTYSFVITDAANCQATGSVVITEPDAITSSQTINLCFGGSYTVGANTYTLTGIYTDIFTAINGCDSTVTTDLTIYDAVDVSATALAGTITATLSGASYQWINCDTNTPEIGETSQSFTPALDGNYAVIVTLNNCSDTSQCINITNINVNSTNMKVAFTSYPNPTNGNVYVNTNIENADMNISIVDINGKEVYMINGLNEKSNLINVENLCPGVYFMKVYNKEKSMMVKLVKE